MSYSVVGYLYVSFSSVGEDRDDFFGLGCVILLKHSVGLL